MSYKDPTNLSTSGLSCITTAVNRDSVWGAEHIRQYTLSVLTEDGRQINLNISDEAYKLLQKTRLRCTGPEGSEKASALVEYSALRQVHTDAYDRELKAREDTRSLDPEALASSAGQT